MAVLCKTAARIVAGIVLLQSVAVYSPAQEKNIVSLRQLIDSAQHHLPLLLQKQALADAAKASITDARHAYLPSAVVGDEVSLGTDNSLPGSYQSFGLIPSTSAGVRNENNYQPATGNIGFISSQYELVNFGLKNARISNAISNADVSQADVTRDIYLLKWQIGKIYFNILKNQYQLSIDAENIKRYEDIYKVIHAITAAGIKAGVDSSLALAELSKTRITYNQTEGQISQLQQQLSYLTGIPAQQVLIDTTGTKTTLGELNLVNQNTDTAGNPLVDYYQKQQVLYRSTETLVKKSYLPKILLTGTAWARGSGIDYNNTDYKSLGSGLGYQRFNYMAGVTFVYDLFNTVHRKDKLAVNHYNTQAGDYALQQEKLSLQNTGNQAGEAINTAYKNLQEIPVQVTASQDAFNQKTAQYKAGIINLVDLTNASFVLYRSQSDYVQTLSNWLLANLDKAAATGNLDLFIKTVNK